MRLVARLSLIAVVSLLTTGCLGDVAQQVVKDPQVAGRIMDVIAGKREMALGMVDRLVSSDSLRTAVVDRMLENDAVSQQVLERIATNSNALDYVVQVAVQDPAMRDHLVSLVKGIEMASAAPAK